MSGTDRLFVPLNTEPWRAFKSGEKTAEFRGVNSQFNPETVFEGRRVELRRGYSTDDSLWGTIEDVTVDDNFGDLVQQYLDDLQYGGKTKGDIAYSANQLVGDYNEYIVFTVQLDRSVDTATDQSDNEDGADENE